MLYKLPTRPLVKNKDVMNKLTVIKPSELSLKKTKNLLDVTRKVLTPRNNIAVVDDSWMERLLAWADENDINEKDLPRDKSGLTNLQELTLFDNKLTELPKEIGQLTRLGELNLSENNLTEVPKEIVNLTNLKRLSADKGVRLTREQTNWIEQFNIDIEHE
jgi:Leucine-rich repeat (LRR) protein